MLKFGLLSLVLISFGAAPAAFGQMTQLPESFLAIPHQSQIGVNSEKTRWSEPSSSDPTHLSADPVVDRIAAELDRQFQSALQAQTPRACTDPRAVEYLTQLLISQKFGACADFARACAQTTKLKGPQLLEIGAECEAGRFHPGAAKALYDLATSDRFKTADDYPVSVLKAAANAYHGIYEGETEKILRGAFPQDQVDLWKAVIAENEIPPYTRAEIQKFLGDQLKLHRGRLLSVLKAFKLRKTLADYNYSSALAELEQFAPDFESPLAWYALAYKTIYRSSERNFSQARKIYDVYDRYSGPTWVLPTEENTYNYTELYGSVCSKWLLLPDDLAKFDLFKEQIRTGQIGPSESLTQMEKMVTEKPGKADVLTTYGALLALNGRHEEAMKAYWEAHLLCRYYNRANWGLTLERRYLQYRSYPDYVTNERRVKAELAGRTVPREIRSYIRNWSAFDRLTQERIEYGGRVWLPFIPALQSQSFTTYIKFSFDLLSESPGLASIRDERIGGPGYPNDNRLWDDVRGLGGETVVADAAEVFQTVQGDYNLLGHEIAHQFQQLLEVREKQVAACIPQLYEEARARGRFPDPYSAQNNAEHFAQGITYSLVPEDSPKRFGLNRSWLFLNDPNQLRFIESIETAEGDLKRITCAN